MPQNSELHRFPRKVGIEEPGADCLRWSGYNKSCKNIVILCEAPLEKDKEHLWKTAFPRVLLIFF